jgi:hypothetical protein
MLREKTALLLPTADAVARTGRVVLLLLPSQLPCHLSSCASVMADASCK